MAESRVRYQWKRGRLYYKGKLVLPQSSLQISKLNDLHGSSAGGHFGSFWSYKRVASVVYWERMKKDIQQFIASRDTCQHNKYETWSPAGLLQHLQVPTQLWTDISMDFIVGLPKAKGLNTILVVVDSLTTPTSLDYVTSLFCQGYSCCVHFGSARQFQPSTLRTRWPFCRGVFLENLLLMKCIWGGVGNTLWSGSYRNWVTKWKIGRESYK